LNQTADKSLLLVRASRAASKEGETQTCTLTTLGWAELG
jgi:hypothetical protein